MLDVLSEDFVRTARAKGLPESRIVMRHALGNALVPIITVVGLTAALLVGGAIITGYVLLSAQLAGGLDLPLLLPQIALSILAYPLAARLVGAVDRLRLIPIKKY